MTKEVRLINGPLSFYTNVQSVKDECLKNELDPDYDIYAESISEVIEEEFIKLELRDISHQQFLQEKIKQMHKGNRLTLRYYFPKLEKDILKLLDEEVTGKNEKRAAKIFFKLKDMIRNGLEWALKNK